MMTDDEFNEIRRALRDARKYKKRLRYNGNVVIKYQPTPFSMFKRIELTYDEAKQLGVHDNIQRGAKTPPTDINRASTYH